MELRQGLYADFLSNETGGRLCSSKLREIIEENRTAIDSLEWLEVDVLCGDEVRPYAFLHFPLDLDILNEDMTKRVDGFIIKPVFDTAKIYGRNIFSIPGQSSIRLYVSEVMKRKIEMSDVTGVSFLRMATY